MKLPSSFSSYIFSFILSFEPPLNHILASYNNIINLSHLYISHALFGWKPLEDRHYISLVILINTNNKCQKFLYYLTSIYNLYFIVHKYLKFYFIHEENEAVLEAN